MKIWSKPILLSRLATLLSRLANLLSLLAFLLSWIPLFFLSQLATLLSRLTNLLPCLTTLLSLLTILLSWLPTFFVMAGQFIVTASHLILQAGHFIVPTATLLSRLQLYCLDCNFIVPGGHFIDFNLFIMLNIVLFPHGHGYIKLPFYDNKFFKQDCKNSFHGYK